MRMKNIVAGPCFTLEKGNTLGVEVPAPSFLIYCLLSGTGPGRHLFFNGGIEFVVDGIKFTIN